MLNPPQHTHTNQPPRFVPIELRVTTICNISCSSGQDRPYPGATPTPSLLKPPPLLMHVLGEAGLPQTQQEAAVPRPVPGLPEAVHLSGPDQSPGASETPQRPVSH